VSTAKREGIRVESFVVSVLDQINAGNLILNIITGAKDIDAFKQALSTLDNELSKISLDYSAFWNKFAKMETEQAWSTFFSKWQNIWLPAFEAWNQQISEARAGNTLTSQAWAQIARIRMLGYGYDAFIKALIGIPSDIAVTKAERYWNKLIGYEYPPEKDLILLWKLGKEKAETVINYYRENLALNEERAKNITELRKWQVGYPSLPLMIALEQLNKIEHTTVIDYMKNNYGYDTTMAENVYNLVDYTPSPFEIMRLSDLIPLDNTWVEQQLKENGMTKDVRDIYLKAIAQRPLRQEAERMAATLMTLYQYGCINDSEFKDCLSKLNQNTKEIDAKLLVAKLLREKYVTLLKRDAKIYLYRRGVYSESTLRDKLVSLGISLDVANAIVELEAAKQGIELVEE
jgi:hypothetical protein